MAIPANSVHSIDIERIRYLLQRINAAGINISPDALLYIEKIPLTNADIEQFVQNLNFVPNFKAFITIDLLQQKLNLPKTQPLLDTLSQISEIRANLEQQGYGQPDDSCSKVEETLLKEEDNILAESQPVDEALIIQKTPDSLLPLKSEEKIGSKPEIDGELSLQPKSSSKIRRFTEDARDEGEENTFDPDADSDNLWQSTIPAERSSETIDAAELQRIQEEKRRMWQVLQTQPNTKTFRPKAKDYDAELKILKDPTGKLHTEGKLEEFLEFQMDKFEKLKRILKNHPEGANLYEIAMINRISSSTEVSFIAMVTDKHQTSKKNIILDLEDPTGICTVLIRSENKEIYDLTQRILPDHVIIISAYLKVDPQSNSRIIIAKNIYFPDSPTTHTVNCPEEDLAICFISDTHFGSKDWIEQVWHRFVEYLNCEVGDDRQLTQAGKIKYLCIAGDLVEGIGVYPNQEKRLEIFDIYKQYEIAAQHLQEIPDYIKIIISPGDHDSVRKALPAPAIPKNIAPRLYDLDYLMVGNPALLSLHGVNTEIFHGTSLIDLNMSIPGLSNEDPVRTMKELIIARDLVPTYGRKTELAPVEKNWLILDTLPDILHTGHLHKNGCGWYHGILLVNSGCFQRQTEFMQSLGIIPDIGKPTIVNLQKQLSPMVLDLASSMNL